MEEQVGQLWHRLITRAAETRFPQAAVALEEVRRTVGVLFRALEGDGGLRVEAALATEHGARRGLLQRIAGSQTQTELAWRDAEGLRLPARIDLFPERALNRDLYLWLAALAAVEDAPGLPWLAANQRRTLGVLERLPGLSDRYQRLVAAHLRQRPPIEPLRDPAERQQEAAIRQALREPGSVERLPPAQRPPQPVPLWLHPSPPRSLGGLPPLEEEAGQEQSSPSADARDQRRRQTERSERPESKKGLLALRFESIFTRAEMVNVDRCSEDEEDTESAQEALEDLDRVTLRRDSKPSASRLKFDLDLPAAENDDQPLGEGILLPEWDFKRQQLLRDHCRLQPMVAAEAPPLELPTHLRPAAHRIRRQFEALLPRRVWFRGQPDGSEIDLDAFLQHRSDRRQEAGSAEQGLYREFRGGERDLACLLLADLSLSTDAWVNNQCRVIEVIRDGLFLFAEALHATGDPFALYGFSSRNRNHVRFNLLKGFDEGYTPRVRGRIHAIKPGYYTRMGAAIRHASDLLAKQPYGRRLLLLLTDGKPNDLDKYEGRYGVEDTRRAIREARQQGLQVFCVTIDEQGRNYLPYLFGSNRFIVVRRPQDLPKELPLLYYRLTREQGH